MLVRNSPGFAAQTKKSPTRVVPNLGLSRPDLEKRAKVRGWGRREYPPILSSNVHYMGKIVGGYDGTPESAD